HRTKLEFLSVAHISGRAFATRSPARSHKPIPKTLDQACDAPQSPPRLSARSNLQIPTPFMDSFFPAFLRINSTRVLQTRRPQTPAPHPHSPRRRRTPCRHIPTETCFCPFPTHPRARKAANLASHCKARTPTTTHPAPASQTGNPT